MLLLIGKGTQMNRLDFLQHCRKALTDAGISFTEQYTQSNGFHGTRFVFNDRKSAKAAEKALNGKVIVTAFWHQWCFAVY